MTLEDGATLLGLAFIGAGIGIELGATGLMIWGFLIVGAVAYVERRTQGGDHR